VTDEFAAIDFALAAHEQHLPPHRFDVKLAPAQRDLVEQVHMPSPADSHARQPQTASFAAAAKHQAASPAA
jgi:hypothetical protein